MLCVAADSIIYNILSCVTEEHLKQKPAVPSSKKAT